MRYPFEKLFLVCTGPRCSVERVGTETGAAIQAELKELNKKLGRKPTVRVCQESCLGLCDHGPNMVVEPDGTVYTHLTCETARARYSGETSHTERERHLGHSRQRMRTESKSEKGSGKSTKVSSKSMDVSSKSMDVSSKSMDVSSKSMDVSGNWRTKFTRLTLKLKVYAMRSTKWQMAWPMLMKNSNAILSKAGTNSTTSVP